MKQVPEYPFRPTVKESSERGRAARGQRWRGGRGNVRRYDGLQGVGQGRRFHSLLGKRCRRKGHGHAQGAVHAGAGGLGLISLVAHHPLDDTTTGTHHVHGLGRHQRRSHGHTQRQREPHQHEAGGLMGVTQGLQHGFHAISVGRVGQACDGLERDLRHAGCCGRSSTRPGTTRVA